MLTPIPKVKYPQGVDPFESSGIGISESVLDGIAITVLDGIAISEPVLGGIGIVESE